MEKLLKYAEAQPMAEADHEDSGEQHHLGELLDHLGAQMSSPHTGVAHLLPPHIEAMVVRDMQDLGLDPEFIYAFQHTGLLVTDATIDGYSDAELVTWQAALDRYRRLEASVA